MRYNILIKTIIPTFTWTICSPCITTDTTINPINSKFWIHLTLFVDKNLPRVTTEIHHFDLMKAVKILLRGFVIHIVAIGPTVTPIFSLTYNRQRTSICCRAFGSIKKFAWSTNIWQLISSCTIVVTSASRLGIHVIAIRFAITRINIISFFRCRLPF